MVPNKPFYEKNEKVHDISCKELSLRYEGSNELICSADGEWIGNHQCSERKNYFSILKGTATLMIRMFYQKELYEP